MAELLKFFGIGLLFFSAFVFSSEYEKRIKTKNAVSEGFLLLLLHIRRQIDCYLTPPSMLLSGFENKALSECGFSEYAVKNGLSEAFMQMKDSLPLYQSVKAELSGFFSVFGKDYKLGTVKELDCVISAVKEKMKKEKEEGEKNVKVVRILAASAAVGVVILII